MSSDVRRLALSEDLGLVPRTPESQTPGFPVISLRNLRPGKGPGKVALCILPLVDSIGGVQGAVMSFIRVHKH